MAVKHSIRRREDTHNYFVVLDAEPDKVFTQRGSLFASFNQPSHN
jgi:hypothetical protein